MLFQRRGRVPFLLQSGLEQGKNDRKIEGIILKLYEYSGSYPRPEQWLDRCAAVYTEEEAAEAMIRRAKEHVLIRIEEPEKLIRRGLKICEEPDGPYMYADMLEEDLRGIEKIRKCSDFAEMYDAADRFVWKNAFEKKMTVYRLKKRESVKALREQAKKRRLPGVKETYFYAPESVWKEDMVSAGESVKTLVSFGKAVRRKSLRKRSAAEI